MKVFVSSTFRDFHKERDAIRNYVQPRLNEFCRGIGEEYSFIDLRWGVDTSDLDEEESAKKVLSVCLSEIDNAAPYMIVMLGGRYGYRPGKELIMKALEQHGLGRDELPDADISVTQLEIEYGFLMRGQKAIENVWFYFKECPEDMDSQSEEDRQKLKELKDCIMRIAPERVRTYVQDEDGDDAGLARFRDMVVEDLSEAVRKRFEEIDEFAERVGEHFEDMFVDGKELGKKFYKEAYNQQSVFGRYIRQAVNVRSYETAEKLPDLLCRYIGSPIFYRGAVGSGKSIAATLTCLSMQKRSFPAVYVYCDRLMYFHDAQSIAYYIIMSMYALNLDSEEIKSAFIMIDSIESLGDEEARKLIGQLQRISQNNPVLVVTDDRTPYYADFNSPGIRRLGEEDCKSILEHILAGMSKSLPADVEVMLTKRSFILEEKYGTGALWLYFAAHELALMDTGDFMNITSAGDGMESIHNYLMQRVGKMSDSLEVMSVDLLTALCKSISLNLLRILYYIAISKTGLRDTDLYELARMEGFDILPLDLSRLINSIPDLFLTRADGRIDFTHTCIRDGFMDELERNKELKRCAFILSEYVKDVLADDEDSALLWIREYLRLKLMAGDSPAVFEEIKGQLPKGLIADSILNYLFDHRTPEDIGYLETPGRWRTGTIDTFEEISNEEYLSVYEASAKRGSCIDPRGLPSVYLQRVLTFIKGLESYFGSCETTEDLKDILKFFSQEFMSSYKDHVYEGREYSKRIMAAILFRIVNEPFVAKISVSVPMFAGDFLSLATECCNILISTGFYKDRDEANYLAVNILNLFGWLNPDPSEPFGKWDTDVMTQILRFSYTYLNALPEDAYLEHSPERAQILRTREGVLKKNITSIQQFYPQTSNYCQEPLPLWIQFCLKDADYRIDDRDYESAERIYGVVEMNTEQLKISMEELQEQDGAGTEAFALGVTVLVNAFIDLSWFYSSVHSGDEAEDRRLREKTGQYMNEAFYWWDKLADTRKRTVSGKHLHFRAGVNMMRILRKVSPAEYEGHIKYWMREINKFRHVTGSRESLLDSADLYEIHGRYLENSQDSLISRLISDQSYTQQAGNMRAKAECWDPICPID